MSYKRFISYIYSYEKSIKSKNSGFARVEIRDNLCKISISLRIEQILMSDTEDNSLGVYLYRQEGDFVDNVSIGRVKIEKSASSFKSEFAANNIMNSGMKIEDISGIFICADSFMQKRNMIGLTYASEWKDTQIQIDRMSVSQRDGHAQPEMEDSKRDLQAADLEEQGIFETRRSRKDIKELEEILGDAAKDTARRDATVEEETAKREGEATEEHSRVQEQESEETVESEKPREPEIADYYVMLSNCYPKADISELNGECIRITPHDITYLPRKFWHLCNNSFLLHSYYNYRYIFLLKENQGENYAILVPGVNNKKEMAMARIYGFRKFSGESDDNKIGYWYMYL